MAWENRSLSLGRQQTGLASGTAAFFSSPWATGAAWSAGSEARRPCRRLAFARARLTLRGGEGPGGGSEEAKPGAGRTLASKARNSGRAPRRLVLLPGTLSPPNPIGTGRTGADSDYTWLALDVTLVTIVVGLLLSAFHLQHTLCSTELVFPGKDDWKCLGTTDSTGR